MCAISHPRSRYELKKSGGSGARYSMSRRKSFILGEIERPTPPSAMKVVDARLQHVTQVEQLAIAGSKAAYYRAKPVPEAFDREPRLGQGLFIYEIIKSFRNAQSACLDGVHVTVPYLRPPAAGHLSGPNIANEGVNLASIGLFLMETMKGVSFLLGCGRIWLVYRLASVVDGAAFARVAR